MNLFSKIKDNPLLSFLIFLLVLAFGAFVGVLFTDCPETWISPNLLGVAGKDNPKYEALKFLGIGMGGVLGRPTSPDVPQACQGYGGCRTSAGRCRERTSQSYGGAGKSQPAHRAGTAVRSDLETLSSILGHESDSVRLGGAYELFHLAKDTLDAYTKEKSDARLYWTFSAPISAGQRAKDEYPKNA